ncbi:MAG: protoporphyrinogen oxidase [Bacteroidales bacterium]|nr:protoporphyrinogen oxidase [Bacteroidales bacterium]
MKEEFIDTVVLGAGLTGLTTAYYLNKQNCRFRAIDKNDRAGGVIHTHSENGFIYETGPNTGVIGNTAVVGLFDELADMCELEIGNEKAKKRYILKNGKWEHLPLGLIDAVKCRLFTTKDKLRLLTEPFRAKGNDPDENLSSFVRRRLGESFLKYAIDPFILGVYAGDTDYIIPRYALPKLYNLEQQYGSLIKGAIRKKFEKKNDMEKRVSKKVFSFYNGMSSLINALYQKAGKENFIFSAGNVKVEKTEKGYTIQYSDTGGNLYKINAKNIISTLGAYELESVFPFINREQIDKVKNLKYAQVIEVSVGFTKWEGMKLDGFGGLIPSVEKRKILGILFMSSLFKNRAPENGALLTIFLGGTKNTGILELDDNEIVKIVESECSSLLGIKSFNPDLLRVIRHRNAIPQYGTDSKNRFEAVEAIENEHEGLKIAGNLRNGIGMADRIKQAYKLAQLFV